MKNFFAVGIGASGGGITAISEFLESITADSGYAFIVITHIKRDHLSLLDKILARHTCIPVTKVTADMKIEPDHVYVMVENTFLTINNGILQVQPRHEDQIINRAVDVFFTSLAADFKEKAIGIVLSGAGTDGLEGAKAIEKAGGLVMVQTPEDSKFSGMPHSVIEYNGPHVIDRPVKLAEYLIARANKQRKRSEV
jgi:two-component system, chemotaxis family, protein-glutamate methylesterase/glutaminase